MTHGKSAGLIEHTSTPVIASEHCVRTILVIEDSPLVLKVLEHLFRQEADMQPLFCVKHLALFFCQFWKKNSY